MIAGSLLLFSVTCLIPVLHQLIALLLMLSRCGQRTVRRNHWLHYVQPRSESQTVWSTAPNLLTIRLVLLYWFCSGVRNRAWKRSNHLVVCDSDPLLVQCTMGVRASLTETSADRNNLSSTNTPMCGSTATLASFMTFCSSKPSPRNTSNS